MHNVIIIALSIFLSLMIFVWGTAGNLLSLFSMSFPRLHFLFVIFLIATLVAGKETRTIHSVLKRLSDCRYWLIPCIGFTIALCINLFAFDNIPHVQDEIHYKYMAETLAEGRLAQEMPVHYEFFNYVFFLVDGETHFSIFMPGYPIFLIPFALLGITFLANPILTAVNIFLVGKLAQDLFGEMTSTVSMLLYLASPFMMTMGGTWMAHPFTGMLTLVVVFGYLKSCQSKSSILQISAGIALGWLVLSRPQNALFLAVWIPIIWLKSYRQQLRYKHLLWFAFPVLFSLVALAAYNNCLTGNPVTFAQDVYFNMSEPVNGCHSILPKRGCLHCNEESPPIGGMTWHRGFEVTRQRLVPLVLETFPHPIYFVFAIVSLLASLGNREERRRKIFLIALFLSPIIGYFFFYFNGNVYGPRYLYEGAIFFVIVVASGIEYSYRRLGERRSYFWKSCLSSFFLATISFQVMFTVPMVLEYYRQDFWNVGSILKEESAIEGIENSVIFVKTPDAESYGSGLVAMDLGRLEGNTNIFVRDLGDASNSRYMHYMSGRDFYQVAYFPRMAKRLKFLEIEAAYPEDYIHVEFEDKFPPYVTAEDYPDYCNRYPAPERVYPYLKFSRIPGIRFSRGRSLYCRFENPAQRYTFGQYFQSAGVYDGTIAALTGPVFGDFELLMDDREAVSFESSGEDNVGVVRVNFRVSVSEGLHTFSIAPKISSLPDRNFVMLDYIRFNIVGDRMPGVGEAISNQPAGVGQRTEKEGPEGG